MSFFNLFHIKKKGKKKDDLSVSIQQGNKKPEEFSGIKSERKVSKKEDIKEICHEIIEAARQIDETKVEYQAVTSYLTDMQKMDHIPLEDKSGIEDAARNIYNLTKERQKHQDKKRIKISESQYRYMERYEDVIPDEIIKMKQNEEYYMLVKNDMRNLEGEKGGITYQQEEIVKQQEFLKIISVVTSIIVLGLFALFFFFSFKEKKDMTIPFILTIIMAAISGIYIFYEARKNQYNMMLAEKKMSKAIGLLNSVKIKYINTTNVLEYSHSKYMVNNSNELEFVWKQYMRIKDEEKRYQNNTELLDYYNETLIRHLRRYQIHDPDIWIHQAIAIIDDKEMVEIRHRLNVRRQKLRERIDYNSNIKETYMEAIREILQKKPEWKAEVIRILGSHKNNLT